MWKEMSVWDEMDSEVQRERMGAVEEGTNINWAPEKQETR
jgi:hypothetical protein